MKTEEVKAKINTLEQELAALESLVNTSKKFEFTFEPGETYKLLDCTYISGYKGIGEVDLEAGLYKTTKEGADLSLARNRRANRIEMLAEYLGGLKEFKKGEDNCYVYQTNVRSKPRTTVWLVGWDTAIFRSEQVYMTREVAYRVAQILNNKEYEL